MARFYIYDGSKYVPASADTLTFTGAVTDSYDGSRAKTVNIPSAVTDDHINSLIDTKLEVIESGTTYIAVNSTSDVISTVNGETYADIQALIDAGKPVVVRYEDILDFYYFETFGFSDSSGIHKRLNFRCDMGSIVYTLTLRDDNTWVFRETNLQTSSITDSGSYFTTDTVEGALQEIGAELAGINTLLGSGIQISFTIEDATCTANAGETFSEWIGSGYKTLENGMMLSVPYGDDGVVLLDEAGVFAASLDGNTPVYGGDRIISGGTYIAMHWGG